MTRRRTFDRLLLLVVLAFTGFVLVYVPQLALQQYRAVAELGRTAVIVYFSVVGTGALLLLVATLWIVVGLWRRTRHKRRQRVERDKAPSRLTAEEKQRELEENLASVDELRSDEVVSEQLKQELEPLVRQIMEKRQRQTLQIVAFGTVSGGKSSLLNALAGRDVFRTDAKAGTTIRRNEIPWPGMDQVMLVDTPGLGEIEGPEHVHQATQAAKDADIVLLVVDGPLRQSEIELLELLADMEKRILVCLNKEDWYSEPQRDALLNQLTEQVSGLVHSEDVLAVRSNPAIRRRTRVLPDGREIEEDVEMAPYIAPLAERMMRIVQQDGRDLLLANLLLQSRGLVGEARQRVRQSLDRRAWQIVDRAMWTAGGAAAVSPLPILDLAAGGAVTTKMVLDLARVYRQDVDIETAARLLAQLGKNLIAILGVSAATPAVTSGVASVLKTVPGAGTIAGGALQGCVQAVVTRWIGAVFVEYFGNEMQHPEGGLAGLARRKWDQVTSVAELRKLVQGARRRFDSTEQDSDLS